MLQKVVSRSYATFEYYQTEYGGSTISEEQFNHVARKSSMLVDRLTFGRVGKMDPDSVPDFVKDAVCAASEVYFKQGDRSTSGIQSESNDGYSVSYGDGSDCLAVEKNAASVIRAYLSGTGLLFSGFSPGEMHYGWRCPP